MIFRSSIHIMVYSPWPSLTKLSYRLALKAKSLLSASGSLPAPFPPVAEPKTRVYTHSDNHMFNRVLYCCILLFHTPHNHIFPTRARAFPLISLCSRPRRARLCPHSGTPPKCLVSPLGLVSVYARGCVERGAGPMPRPR
jgi:hypothetical protein